MNAILSRRKTGAVILAFILIFFIAIIFVQSIYVPKVDASPAALAALLSPYTLPILVLLLAIGGVVYADFEGEWQSQDVVSAFADFVTNYYEDYLQYDLLNFLESFQTNESVRLGDVPVPIRRAFLEFSIQQANDISIGGQFGYESPYVSRLSATGSTGSLKLMDVPSYAGVGFAYEVERLEGTGSVWASHHYMENDTDGSYTNFFDRWAIIFYGSEAYGRPGEIELQYYMRSNGSFGVQHAYSGPYAPYYDAETGEYCKIIIAVGDNSVSIFSDTGQGQILEDVIFPQQDNPDRWTRFTGHSDICIQATMSTIDVISAEAGTITGNDVIDDGTAWREEHGETMEYPVIPPWVELGQETINLPSSVGDITGEGVGVGDVTVPVDTTTDYPVEYPDTMTGVGDVPLDIPNVADGDWINNFNFDWTVFADVTTRFPLSIPWDIQRVFALFNHYESEPPEITFTLGEIFPNWSVGGSQEYAISFEFIEPYAEFIRWMLWILMVMAFVIFLLKHYIAQ